MDIKYLDRKAPSGKVVVALRRDGAAAVRDQLSGYLSAADATKISDLWR
jgi:hypothetical protein